MMSTTTIRIEDDLKARIAAVAKRAGKTPHAFIIDAIAATVEQAEQDDAFHRIADERWAKVLATGRPSRGTMRNHGSRRDREASERSSRSLARLDTISRMARVELAPEFLDDFDGFFEHMARFEVEDAVVRIGEIVQAIEILTHSPLVGRPVRSGKRELVIGRGSRGYVALYRFVASVDTVFVIAIRSQREAGFARES